MSATIPARTRRDIRVPGIPGKALAVIGVRRGGKTSLLHVRMAARVAEGQARESQLLLELEDERLEGMTAQDLGWIIEEHGRRYPHVRRGGALGGTLWLDLDEVQVVPRWETLVHRLLDAGDHLSAAERAALDHAMQGYLRVGGFPEAQSVDAQDHVDLLTGYVDTMVLRDVIERHDVKNVRALRWLQRQILATPGGNVSVKKLYDALKSQGIGVGKDAVYAYIGYLDDAFLIRRVPMHSASERQRMANPEKIYPVDTGLISIYERSGRTHHGRTLETATLLELERRGYSARWLRTTEGWEVDFLAERVGKKPLLIQVCLDTTQSETLAREVRALESAAAMHPDAVAVLVTLDPSPPRSLPARLQWQPAAQWLLEPS